MNLNRDDLPTFWPQPTSSSSSMPRRRSSSSSPLLSLPILIVILPIFALLFLFFAVPPFLSVTSHIFRPYHTVKNSWDSLNIVLVLFAILCGVLARRNDDVSDTNQPVDENDVVVVVDSDHKINDQTHPQQWFDQHYSVRKVYDPPPEAATATGTRRLRNSSSYPDLRQDSLWETGDDRFRLFDDFDIQDNFRSPVAVPENNNYGHLRRTRSDIEESQVKVIPVDTFVLRSTPLTSLPKSPTRPPPPPPPPPAVSQKPRRTYQTVGRKERSKVESAPPPPPLPRPAPQPSQTGNQSEQKYVKLERKTSNATREIKMVLSSILYNQSRKRKKKQKTKNISDYADSSFHSPREQPQYSTIPPPSPPPPPPPLPPLPSVFHNLFRKSSKSKKVHSVPPPAPPPPPQRSSKRKGHSHTPPPPPPPQPAPPTPPRQPQPSRRQNAGKPPLPTRANSNLYEEYTMNISGGNQSPLNRMPPPPPLPPFIMAEPRFAVRGDFVSIHSSNSSRCSSPDHLEKVELSSTHHDDSPRKVNSNITTDGGDNGSGSVFCPSPDVNAKADDFIARLRVGWRLERDNSIKEKRNTAVQ
ncbi:hypothetical protein Ddye_020483 [Dipteronia dyeriana]|uniref:Uncharacterized protein n=1 Tax=Dipteronia dyeriana TaxID=168575 RepID=A0AAD9WWM0_9ROSI|nr:hypothetical protein Ddye_020483 [Dipteronia dyeriana]